MKELTFGEWTQRAKEISDSLIDALTGTSREECMEVLEDFKRTHKMSKKAEEFMISAIMTVCRPSTVSETA